MGKSLLWPLSLGLLAESGRDVILTVDQSESVSPITLNIRCSDKPVLSLRCSQRQFLDKPRSRLVMGSVSFPIQHLQPGTTHHPSLQIKKITPANRRGMFGGAITSIRVVFTTGRTGAPAARPRAAAPDRTGGKVYGELL